MKVSEKLINIDCTNVIEEVESKQRRLRKSKDVHKN
jgi:hypothetical protein